MNGKSFEAHYKMLVRDFIQTAFKGCPPVGLRPTEKLAIGTLVFNALSVRWSGYRPTLGSMLAVSDEIFSETMEG